MVRNDKTGEFENLLPGIDTETLPGTLRGKKEKKEKKDADKKN